MHVFKASVGGSTFQQSKMCELTNLDVRNGHSIKFGLVYVVSRVLQTKKNVDTKKIAPVGGKVLYRPLEELQRAVKYFTAR
jgi:hypothetical protein